MKKAAFGWIIGLFLAAAPAHADGTGICYPQKPRFINIRLDIGVAHDDPYTPAAELAKMYGDNTHSSAEADGKGIISGLARSALRGHVDPIFATFKMINMYACPIINKLDYTVYFEPEVYIASELKTQGCRYGVTARHEQRHIDIEKDAVSDSLPALEQAMRDYFAKTPTHAVSTFEALDKEQIAMTKALEAAMQVELDKIKTANRAKQAAIDTPGAIMREQDMCPYEYNPPPTSP